MPLLVAYVGHFHENAPWHLPLYAQAVVSGSRKRQIRINGADLQERRSPSGATGGVGQIAVLKCRRLDKWRDVELRENDVALGFIVKKADAAADGRAVVA